MNVWRFDNLIARDAYRGLFKAQRLPKSNSNCLRERWRLADQKWCGADQRAIGDLPYEKVCHIRTADGAELPVS